MSVADIERQKERIEATEACFRKAVAAGIAFEDEGICLGVDEEECSACRYKVSEPRKI